MQEKDEKVYRHQEALESVKQMLRSAESEVEIWQTKTLEAEAKLKIAEEGFQKIIDGSRQEYPDEIARRYKTKLRS